MDTNYGNLLFVTVTGTNQELREKVTRFISVILSSSGFQGTAVKAVGGGAKLVNGHLPKRDNAEDEKAFVEGFLATIPDDAFVMLLEGETIDDVIDGALATIPEGGNE